MKNIKVRVIAVMLVAVMALTGCMKMDMGFVINSDGSASAETVVNVDRQALIDATLKGYKEAGMPVSEAEIAKQYDESMAQEGLKLVTVDGKQYYQTKETQTVKKGGLQKAFGDEGISSYVTTDTFYIEMDLSKMEGMGNTQEVMASYKQMGADIPSDAFKAVMTVQFPNAIVSTNGTTDKGNPNKVTFNMSFDKKNTMFATTKKGVTISTVKAAVKKLNAIKAPKIKKLKANAVKKKAKKASVTLKFGSVKGAKIYQIQCSLKKNFKGAKTKAVKKTTYTIKNLKKGTKYNVRVRASKVNYAGVTVYSKWSRKTVKTKSN